MLRTLARPLYSSSLYSRSSLLHTSATVRNTAEPQTTARKPSAAPKGTVLKGIQYLKDKQDPVALDDAEYPEWLWDLLDEKKQKQKTTKPSNRQYHRKQNRDAIKAMNFMKDKKN
ncbi:mitochondrial ribosomal protein L37-domain-containing protein [Gilbertella persicaria]|uniref:mitochondrial ribosomal protein L37-domain-containing protein n=1 Tax=Gilbertella persicaria TaxID=101096 RepID=UPI00222104F2|nr:mitochondrial ribosomal protein L37-domain-containing protein [Gilbertella persicaria]KAI8087845.1 mitochondrial ribosomal protein L37-domain-containing protein [Gilbertella persicaria]